MFAIVGLVLDDLHDLSQRLRSAHDALTRVPAAELAEVVTALAGLRQQLDTLWVAAVGRADTEGAHRHHAARDTTGWLATLTGDRRASVRRDVELAAALPHAPIADNALHHGVSKAKVAELVKASTLPDDVQRSLATLAETASVDTVANAVREARLDHGLTPPAVTPTATINRHHDRVEVTATLDLVDGEHIEVALDTMAAMLDLPPTMPYPQRRARALAGLARHFLDHARDLPTTRLGRPHVIVLVDLAVLEARTGGTARLASGAVITGDHARRLAHDANINRIITNGASAPVDLGRTTRSVPPHLARGVITRDRHCRYHHCTTPASMCEIHHRQPWAHGGPTSLDNLGLLCWHHHSEVHRQGPHHLTETPDGRWTLTPTTTSNATAATQANAA